jgi:hypothetical protein
MAGRMNNADNLQRILIRIINDEIAFVGLYQPEA